MKKMIVCTERKRLSSSTAASASSVVITIHDRFLLYSFARLPTLVSYYHIFLFFIVKLLSLRFRMLGVCVLH